MTIQSKKLVLALIRQPPGDRWREPSFSNEKAIIYESLTDALNAIFDKTSITDYFISARKGEVYYATDPSEEDVPPPPPPKKFSIYGDE